MSLKDVCAISSGIQGPANLAVRLAKAVARKRDPVVDVVIVTRNASGKLGGAWSTEQELVHVQELIRFMDMAIEDEQRRVWCGELDAGEFDEDQD